MGDSLALVTTSFSIQDHNYKVWNKSQLLVIISRTKLAKITIFVSDKEEMSDALVSLFQ